MPHPEIALDRSSPVPLYHQVATALERAIKEGQLKPDTKLANEVALAQHYNVSRPTMRQAFDQLVRDGLVVRRRGVGTQVVGPPVRRNLKLSSLYNDLVDEGANPGTKVLSLEVIDADAPVREKLSLPEGTDVYHIRRLRLVDGRPLALMENWLRTTITSITTEKLEHRGFYDLLRVAGVDFRMAHQTIGATLADDEQAQLLNTEPGAPLVFSRRTALDSNGSPVESGIHLYRADLYTFDITLVN